MHANSVGPNKVNPVGPPPHLKSTKQKQLNKVNYNCFFTFVFLFSFLKKLQKIKIIKIKITRLNKLFMSN